ncbi:SDR family oxidoreductase [Branchiibius sp. NY16-3462-2]|uniref:SDR family NAD(P)-dependent oxidoreductase n=1 Tax=Branchiibius sp. NY16-3462-2 TaxID=1807500 RepID=UPI0007927410|nr:SDR family NAD(P)-dependent oxidoreductase [Branchiibius sp. NY16-3462-2]KYH44437.1 short-chain dehydrogenase [Branchiibius sp. NY16-3462-2]
MTSDVALVIGSSRGLGLLIARELLAREYEVVITARDAIELDAAARQLTEETGRTAVRPRVCDVRDRDALSSMIDEVAATYGGIDVLIYVAGVIQAGPLESVGLEQFDQAMETMGTGPVVAVLAVLPHMRQRGRGRIGVVTSVGGMISPPHLLPYATAKFAAVGFTDGLAAELSGSGITATTVIPGLMRTGSHGQAEFAGDAAAEYAWFAPAASLPILSIDADRAARRIVAGVLAGRPNVVLTPLTWLGIRVRGLAPGLTTRVMGLVVRTLPAAPGDQPTGTVKGDTARKELGPRALRVVGALTTLGDRAARRTNQRPTT